MSGEVELLGGDAHRQAVADEIATTLRAFNEAVLGAYSFTPASAVIRDDEGRLIAGATGYYGLDCLTVENVWVDDSRRHQGLGGRVMQALEDHARAAGIRLARLETASFQARGFYEKQGYTVFGELDDYPPGHRYFFMKKSLQGG
ncbi:GNAT family N-acetyltransferase [Jeongeupia chitinilytica]|uniref:N-acetyltransferase n=1 Tax=Jeongeupia chitinilytica TaxID=1041641 RepID=A0ABQ3H5W7_9NEIS|nr:GNAT family N-acetyltransferase [Jeongeupia chitinilytica]GHD66560.1 N-acetyltransferase [Jeongeupia chitinilytica]